MKILRIVSLGYEGGGVENGVVLSDAILRAHGHTVQVITGNGRPDLPHYSDYEFSDVPQTGLKRFIYSSFNYSSYTVTKHVLNEYKPDVVLLNTMSQTTASVLFLLKRYPTILIVHGPEVFTTALLPWFLSKTDYKHGSYDLKDLTVSGRLHYYYFKYLSRPVYKLGLRNVDQVVALSNYTKKLLEQEGFQVAYVPNGAELLPFSPSRKDTSCLLYAGRLEKYKGVDDLLRAIPKIQAKIPHVHVEIAGDGTFKSELVQLVQQLHLEKCVTFLGQLSAQHLAAAYVRSSIFVLPSTWPETFGKVGIEAMSTGRPVIATDVGGVTDWLEDGSNGFLVQPRRPEQIADRATILLSDHKLAVQMTHAARRTAERFSIAQMNAHIERLITEVRDRL